MEQFCMNTCYFFAQWTQSLLAYVCKHTNTVLERVWHVYHWITLKEASTQAEPICSENYSAKLNLLCDFRPLLPWWAVVVVECVRWLWRPPRTKHISRSHAHWYPCANRSAATQFSSFWFDDPGNAATPIHTRYSCRSWAPLMGDSDDIITELAWVTINGIAQTCFSGRAKGKFLF